MIMIVPKSLIALTAIAFPTNLLAFQQHQHCIQRRRGYDGDNSFAKERRTRVARSKWSNSAIFALDNDDQSYPHVLPLPPSPKGVIFDMDGTLIQHAIDFAEMRKRIYTVADDCPIGQTLERDCVLALAEKLSPEAMIKCDEIFADIEQRALDDMKINPGGAELIHFLRGNGLKRAVLTRNIERSVSFMADLYLGEIKTINGQDDDDDDNNMMMMEPIFHPMVARDTKSHPNDKTPLKSKPNPDGILHICKVWGCDPSEVIMVGDSANDDMTAANRAGCGGAVLLTQAGGKELDTDSGYEVGDTEEEIMERTPSLRVESLLELKMCLEVLLNEGGVSDGDGANVEMKSDQDALVYNSESG